MATFHIKRSMRGAYLYMLRANNNKVLLWGCWEHSTKTACHSSIALVRTNASDPDRYVSSGIPGFHWFTLRSTQGDRLGLSETYAEATDRDQGLLDVMKVAPEADTEDRS